MITPKQLLEKADRMFNKVVTAALKGEEIFPLVIPADKKLEGTGYNELKASIVPLYEQSKDKRGKGYSVEWKIKMIEGTKQKIPGKLFFETVEDFLYYTKRGRDYEAIFSSYTKLTAAFPSLSDWSKSNAGFLLEIADRTDELIKVCSYFLQHPPPHPLYLRELPIEVHSKFIEDNASALKKLLDVLLPQDWIIPTATDFCSRYQVKKPTIYAQIRVLDETLRPFVGYDELALTLEDSASLSWAPEKVFIIENKACFLSFPKVKNSVAIFGEGFKSRVSKHIPWLSKAQIYCWFDLDAAGFEMLNMIRQYYPMAKSFLMDAATYERYKAFAVHCVYRRLLLNNLDTDEQQLYEYLQVNSKRLEQERIRTEYIFKQIQ